MDFVVETQTSNWNWISFILGILIGAVIIILLAWLAYSQRWAWYCNCRMGDQICLKDDYHTLSEAFQNGFTPQDILEVDSNGILRYKRVPKNPECIPGSNQSIPVIYPQFCLATINDSQRIFTLDSVDGNVATYRNGNTTFEANRHCDPISDFVDSARPIANTN